MPLKHTRQQENNKLREEIKKLKGALKDIQDDILIETIFITKKSEDSPKTLNNADKYFDKLESLKSDEMEMFCKFEDFRDENENTVTENSLIFIPDSSQAQNHSISLEERIKNSVLNCNNISEPSLNQYSPEKLVFSEYPRHDQYQQPRPSFFLSNYSGQSPKKLKTSFESFNDPSEFSPKSKNNSTDQQKLLVEIEALRKENAMLRLQLQAHRSMKKVSPKVKVTAVPYRFKFISELPRTMGNRSKSPNMTTVKQNIPDNIRPIRRSMNLASRSKSKSLTPEDLATKANESPATPVRKRHCNICDHLLTKGYSTKYCSRHGKSNNG